MKFAYADPPYYGCGKLYADQHPDALAWDDLRTHVNLVHHLRDNYDGWAMSLSSPSLHYILEACPSTARICAWVKPFASFKPNVNPAYAWEPVIVCGGRKYTREDDTVRDWLAENITLKRGLTGAKPRNFARWIFALLNAQRGDEFDDLFPGTGAVTAAWQEWIGAEAPPMFALESEEQP